MGIGNVHIGELVFLVGITVLIGAYLFAVCKWAWHSRPEGKKLAQATHVILDLDGKYAGAIQARDTYHAKEVFDTLDMDGSQFYIEEIQLENAEDVR